MAAIPASCDRAAGDWKLSRYTHVIPSKNGGVIYNGRSGAVAEFSTDTFPLALRLIERLGRKRVSGAMAELLHQFQAGGFVVPRGEDEIAQLEAHYNAERRRSQFLFTILPTFACNLGCGYCFVGKKKGVMDLETQDRLIAFARTGIETKRPPSMNVDWFGGEPLLAPAIVERLSRAFLEICDQRQVEYRAQVITNGTRLDPPTVDMLERCRVDRVQITIDGPPSIHDLRRPYHEKGKSSFGAIVEAIPRLLGRFVIRLRINVDKTNLHSVWPLFDFFESRGWIGGDSRFFPYLARVSAFTEACAGFSSQVTTLDEFYQVQFQWMQRLRDRGVAVEEHGLYQFPEPKLYNCGAVGDNGFVFTPDGEVHKCGLEVDDSSRAAGRLGDDAAAGGFPEAARFAAYSPFQNPVCRECEFLPTCLGGCPRDRIDGRAAEIKNNCEYHKRFERELLMFHVGHRAVELPVPGREAASLFPILQ